MYPNEFYYEATISASGYQKEISSQLDIQRFLQGRPDVWVAPKPIVRKIRKHIVFDFSLIKNISFKYRADLIKLINEMINDGFSVYLHSPSPSYQFKKGFVGRQIEDFFCLHLQAFLFEVNDTALEGEIYRLESQSLCFELFKNGALPEYTSRPFSLDRNAYNRLVNNTLELSSEQRSAIATEIPPLIKSTYALTNNVCSQSIMKEIIHRVEYVFFENEIPAAFYSADLSNLFSIKLKNIDIDRTLIEFLQKLPNQELELISCTFDSIDFLNDTVIYLAIQGSLSSSIQKTLLSRLEKLKSLKLIIKEPDHSLVHEITSLHPNLVRLETNLALGLALSKFPNLIMFSYQKNHQEEELHLEFGVSAKTNPQLKIVSSKAYSQQDLPYESYETDSIFATEKDTNLFLLFLSLPHLVRPNLTISSSFFNDLSIPLSRVSKLEIIVEESLSFEQICKIFNFFPSCTHLTLKGDNPWRIIPSEMKNGFKNIERSFKSLEFINLYLEERAADVLIDFFPLIGQLMLTDCVFENNAMHLFFKLYQMEFHALSLENCHKKIVAHNDTAAVNLTFEDVYHALQSSSELDELQLKTLNIDKALHPFQVTPLKNIEHLHISLSHIDDNVFSELIKVLPSLDSLTLIEGTPKSDFYYIPPHSLSSLNQFDAEFALSKKQRKVFTHAQMKVGQSEQYIYDSDSDDESVEDSSSDFLFDPDTACDPNKKFYPYRYFWDISSGKKPISASKYRINIIDTINVKHEPVPLEEVCSLSSLAVDQSALDESSFHVDNIDKKHVKKKFESQIKANTAKLIEGKYTISACNKWVPLPSLSTIEEIVGYYVLNNDESEMDESDEEKDTPQFSRSSKNNLYYVKSSTRITLVFYLLMSHEKILSITLPPYIHQITQYLKEFKPSDIKPKPYLTTKEYCNFVYKNKIGSCRIRALVFKVWMKNYFPDIPTHIVTNECHAFTEIYFNNQWIRIDLGGYPAQLTYMGETPTKSIETAISHSTTTHAIINEHQEYFRSLMTNAPEEHRHNDEDVMIYSSSDGEHHDKDIEDIMRLCRYKPRKILLECENNETFMALPYTLQNHLKSNDKTYCYIHYPESLDCNHPTLALEDGSFKGYYTKEPRSKLYEFLINGKGILIINYDHFSPEQFAQFNDILDDVRQISGLPISPEVSIIGLINKNTPHQPGSDFYSRFDIVKSYNGQEKIDDESLFKGMDVEETLYINLYESDDWESMLLGKWSPSLSGWNFKSGLLTEACLNGHHAIHIQNGPWHLESFRHFWRQVKVDGYFCYADRQIDITPITLTKSEGYTQLPLPLTDRKTKLHVLSGYTYGFFFQNFEVQGKSLVSLPGYIEQADDILSILITEPISKPQWIRFIDEVNRLKKQLHISVAPDVVCEFLDESMDKQSLELSHTQLIHTNDIDGYLSQAKDEVIIDISEINASDLVTSIQRDPQDSETPFAFNIRKGFIEECLERGQSVILKGDFRPDLVYGLLPFLLQDNPRVRLIFEDKQSLGFFKVIDCPIDKKTLLEQKLSLTILPSFINLEESYATCMARYRYWERTMDNDTDHNWQGLSDLEVAHKTPEEYDAKTSIVLRREMIDGVLTTQPYVFIAGLSGVGKTTFIQENLVQADEQLFVGQEYLHAWLTATSTKKIFLFIDEANLTPTQWSIFEGLFLNKPAIFYNGHYYPLSANHKVIFAGNPLSYGGERQLSSLFKKYGHTIVFRPLSVRFIEEVVLQPILQKNPWVMRQISSIYVDLCQQSTHEILITPRELKTLALIAKINYLTTPNKMQSLFDLNVRLFLENRLPKEKRESILREMELRKAELSNFYFSSDIEWGETHRQALHMMQQFLNLHLYRKDNPLLEDEEKFGGLSGMVLESEPGLGKTKMIEMMLRSNHIDELRIPAGANLKTKKEMLYEAFNQGRVVWIDEFNSGPLLEQELNAYLSGHHIDGKRPSRPGFLLIATQNPSTMLGRRRLSPALRQRMVVFEISEYTYTEMIKILKREGMTQEDAECFVKEYMRQKDDYNLNFRDFIKFAKVALEKEDIEQTGKKRSLEVSSLSIFPRSKEMNMQCTDDNSLSEKRTRDEEPDAISRREKIVKL